MTHFWPAKVIERVFPIPKWAPDTVTLVPPDKGPTLGEAGTVSNLGILKVLWGKCIIIGSYQELKEFSRGYFSTTKSKSDVNCGCYNTSDGSPCGTYDSNRGRQLHNNGNIQCPLVYFHLKGKFTLTK